MPRKPVMIDPNRDFLGKPLGVYVPKPKTVLAAQPLLTEGLIRGPNLVVFIPKKQGATIEDALKQADAAKRVIASNKRMDKALVGSDERESIKQVFACWTGTMAAYEKPGKAFGKTVEYTDDKTGIRYIFPVPEEYQGKVNAILIAEHPDYALETDANNRIVRAARVELIEKFPAKDGWHLADTKHGIPFGAEVDHSNSDARYLWRVDSRVGLVVRGLWYDLNRRNVGLGDRASLRFGVACESATVGGAPKI